MRVLKFIVEGQIIKRDPNCDFSNLIPGTDGYLKAEFSFSSEWNGCVKIASFERNGKSCAVEVLRDGKTCLIPWRITENPLFKVRVVGKKDGLRLITNSVLVKQNGGKK